MTATATTDLASIESLAAGGDGVGHLADGMIVFVPRTAPGDMVRLRDVRRHRRHATARLAEVTTASPYRMDPQCPHYVEDRCGGCQWQHVAPGVQASAKSRMVGDALRRIGGLDVSDPPLVASPREFGYRTTITLTVRWSGDRPVAGFHDSEQPDRVFQLKRCHIAREELHRLWGSLQGALGSLPRGDDVRLKLRMSRDGALHVIVVGGEGAWTGHQSLAGALAAGGTEATIWWQPRGGVARRMAGPAAGEGAASFTQVNPEVAGLLLRDELEAVIEVPAVPESRRVRVLDLYGGAGHTALPLAGRGRDVTMIDVDRRAVAEAGRSARALGLSVRGIAGRVEDHLAALLPADHVLLNPPRSGVAESVAQLLAKSPPRRLVYVSCDPATLGRDLKRMGVAASHICALRAYDMFPQTSHVETLVVIERADA